MDLTVQFVWAKSTLLSTFQPIQGLLQGHVCSINVLLPYRVCFIKVLLQIILFAGREYVLFADRNGTELRLRRPVAIVQGEGRR